METNCVQIETVHQHIAKFMESMVEEGYYGYSTDSNLCKLSNSFNAFPVVSYADNQAQNGLMFFIFVDNNTLEALDFQHAREHWKLDTHFNDWLLKDDVRIITKFIPGDHHFTIRSRLSTYLKNYFEIQESQCGPYTLTDEEKESLVEIKLTEAPKKRLSLIIEHAKRFYCETACVEALLYRLESKDYIRPVQTEGVINECT